MTFGGLFVKRFLLGKKIGSRLAYLQVFFRTTTTKKKKKVIRLFAANPGCNSRNDMLAVQTQPQLSVRDKMIKL